MHTAATLVLKVELGEIIILVHLSRSLLLILAVLLHYVGRNVLERIISSDPIVIELLDATIIVLTPSDTFELPCVIELVELFLVAISQFARFLDGNH